MSRHIQQVADAVINSGAHSGVKYLSASRVIRCTRRHKRDLRAKRDEFVLTVGVPNYLEREFIRLCIKAGEPIPVKRVQLKFKKKKL